MRKSIIVGAVVLALLSLAPLVAAQQTGSPLRQATPTAEATATAEPTATGEPTSVSTPSTLPQTGGGDDTASWIPVLIVAIAVTVLLVGMSLSATSRARRE
jgi:hypothetical protein